MCRAECRASVGNYREGVTASLRLNQRADMVVRVENGSLHHVEFQTSNESGFALRMLEYYAWLVRVHRDHVVQTVLYLGREPLRMPHVWTSPSMDFRFDMVNLRELDAEALLESDDWADNALALLAKGEPARVLEVVLPRLRAMRKDDQNWATATLVLLSGILGMETVVNERLKEVGMINIMENKVLGPLIQQGIDRGMEQLRLQQQELLLDLLSDKFGAVPPWAAEQLRDASFADLSNWARRISRATSIEETLR